jgi:hypothetical protein
VAVATWQCVGWIGRALAVILIGDKFKIVAVAVAGGGGGGVVEFKRLAEMLREYHPTAVEAAWYAW